MRTEYDYGREYAEFLDSMLQAESEPIDIEANLNLSQDIPEEDYLTMRREGIDNPNAKMYWQGYNSFFEDKEVN